MQSGTNLHLDKFAVNLQAFRRVRLLGKLGHERRELVEGEERKIGQSSERTR